MLYVVSFKRTLIRTSSYQRSCIALGVKCLEVRGVGSQELCAKLLLLATTTTKPQLTSLHARSRQRQLGSKQLLVASYVEQ